MNDIITISLGAIILILGYILLSWRSMIKKAAGMTKFQTYSKSVDESILDSGIYTEHGMVYDSQNHTLLAQHKRSKLFYESVL